MNRFELIDEVKFITKNILGNKVGRAIVTITDRYCTIVDIDVFEQITFDKELTSQ